MHKNIRKKARQFLIKHRLKKVTLSTVKLAAKTEGYTIVEFNNLVNDKDVNILVEALHLKEYVRTAKGFTYADGNYRLIFLHEDLNDSEKLLVLLHEIGHIVLGHLTANSVIGNDVLQEHEANEFSHYVSNRSFAENLKISVAHYGKWYALGGVLLVALGLGMWWMFSSDTSEPQTLNVADVPANPDIAEEPVQTEKNPEVSQTKPEENPFADGKYFITETGKKYHVEGCRYIKDKAVEIMTETQFNTGFYEPCNYCKPQ